MESNETAGRVGIQYRKFSYATDAWEWAWVCERGKPLTFDNREEAIEYMQDHPAQVGRVIRRFDDE